MTIAAPVPRTRIYSVTDKQSGQQRLIRAASPAAALKFVVEDRFESVYASQELMELAGLNGVTVEVAREEPTVDPAQQPLPGVAPAGDAPTDGAAP